MYKPESVQENESYIILRLRCKLDPPIPTSKQDLMLKKKKKKKKKKKSTHQLMDFDIPAN